MASGTGADDTGHRLLAVRAEEVQNLDRETICWAEPVRNRGIELRSFSRAQQVLLVAEEQAKRAGEHVQPGSPLVAHQLRFTGSEHLLEDLNPSGVPGERYHHASPGKRAGLQPHSRIARLRRGHEPIERHPIAVRERNQDIERRLPVPGLEPGQRTERESGALRQFGECETARSPQSAKARADGIDNRGSIRIHELIFADSANPLGAGRSPPTGWEAVLTTTKATHMTAPIDDSTPDCAPTHRQPAPRNARAIRALVLGAHGAVGTVIRRALELDGHRVTAASRTANGTARMDLRAPLTALSRLAESHDVIINASGIERADLASATGTTPLVDISATSAYLDALRSTATGPVILGAGLVPGLSTILIDTLDSRPGDEIDVFVMLGTGERHGPAAVAWTAGLVGTGIHRPPEDTPVRNLRESRRVQGPDGRIRRYLRADFPDHILRGRAENPRTPPIRSYLTLGAAPLTTALSIVGRLPALRGLLMRAPRLGSEAWHVIARNRRTGERQEASGIGQSEATGRLTALAAVHAATEADRTSSGPITMADIVSLDEALAALEQPALHPR